MIIMKSIINDNISEESNLNSFENDNNKNQLQNVINKMKGVFLVYIYK